MLKILSHYLDEHNEMEGVDRDRHIVHEGWLTIRHTSPQFHNLLHCHGLSKCNPYRELSVDFEGTWMMDTQYISKELPTCLVFGETI
jgi:hypothetical protein